MTVALTRRHLAGLAATLAGGCAQRRRRPPPGEIHLWFTYGGRNRTVLLDLVDRFHAAQAQVRVKATFQGDYFEGLVKLRTGLFVGAAPSVTHVIGEVVPYLAEAGVLARLDEVGEEVVDDLDPALAQSGTFVGGDGRPLWALPFNRSTPVAFFNRAHFAEAGRTTAPATWSEMREVARTLTRRRGPRGPTARWGFECPVAWWFWVALVGQAGGQIVETDGRVSLGDAAGVDAIAHWQAMIHEDRSMKPPPGRDYNAWEATNRDFLAGRVSMIWTSTAFLSYLTEHAPFPLGVAPLPRRDRYSVPTGGTFFVVPAVVRGPEREAVLTFLRFMMSPEVSNHWATQTGYMPVSRRGRRRLRDEGFFARHPNFDVTLQQLTYAAPWPWASDLFRIQREAVQPRLERAVLAHGDAAATLSEARDALHTLGPEERRSP
ncbi:MAG: ABC transporter substrate-binding protein [Myxococcota bacterium]